MLRRLLILFVLSILAVTLSGPVLADQNRGLAPLNSPWDPQADIDLPDDDDDEGDDGMDIGEKIAGAWLGTGEFGLDLDCDGFVDDGVEPTQYDYDSHSFTASGLWIATNPNNTNLGHGTWKQTGPREITADSIVYISNLEDGSVIWIMRIPGVFTFDEEFETATSFYGAVGYLPGQDPLDPTITPAWCTAGHHFILKKVPAAQ